MQTAAIIDRYRGCLLGLATADAFGAAYEFSERESLHVNDEIIGGGPFHLPPGAWTDDTSMALCLAESLIERDGFDPHDQLTRYVKWYRSGYLSSIDRCFDIGVTTRCALHEFERTGSSYCGSTDANTAGNGSLMRLAPVPLFFARHPVEAIEHAGDSSRTTHGAPEAVDACRYLAGLLVGALNGVSKEQLLSDHYTPAAGYWEAHSLVRGIADIAKGSFKHKRATQIVGGSYVAQTLEAALWAFHRTSTFKAGCIRVVGLGDDTDTTAAVFGQLAGAYYGFGGIPTVWASKIAHGAMILNVADRLLALAEAS